jgi:glyoxylase-like metal-dependent hydrolase (beta-lactamase superfamily II)
VGDERAALLDTGSGIGSLKACVESLTNKPLIVLLTHGHVDHAMGAGEFGEVYMNRADDYIFAEHGDMEFRRKSLSIAEPGHIFTEADLLPTPDVNSFRDMKGGDSFDLGGITVEAYDCPGHTKGSIVFLIREERALLLGDACNSFTFMFESYSTSITEYEASLRKLLTEVKGKYDTVYLSHRDGNGHKEMIEDVIKVCEDIRAGNTDDVPFKFKGVSGLIAKAVKPDGTRIDGGKGNIVYNKERV